MQATILRRLKPVRQRQWLVSVAKGAGWGLVVGAAAAIVVAGLRLSQLWDVSAWSGFGLLLGVPLVAAIMAGAWCWLHADWLAAARAVDRHYELKDRTETALAFLRRQQSGSSGKWEELQLADAVSHLKRVEPRQVVPVELPSSWRWAVVSVVVAVVMLCWPSGPQHVSAGPAEAIPEIVVEAENIEDDLQELLEQLPERHDPEIDSLIKDLQAKAEAMKEPGIDVREALAKLSEMQSALQAVAAQFNVAATDEQMQAIGEALQSAEALQPAGQALQAGEYNKAADELAKLDNPQLDRKESRAVSDKLKKSSANAAQKGLKSLSQAAREMAEGIENDNPSQRKDGTSKLADCAKKQGQQKKIGDLLKKQCDKLGECKSNCQNQGSGNRNSLPKNASQQAGKGTNSQIQGERSNLTAKNNRENIQGQKGEQGQSDVETIASQESNEKAQRGYKDVYQKYRKLSDTVLDTEDIPLGHRQTIRRYFEAIRPNGQDAATEERPQQK